MLNKTLRWFLFAMILANIASGMTYPFIPLYLTRLGADVGQVGLVFSIAGLVPLVLQIIGGWLSDSIGRLRTVAIGAAIATLGYFGFALAPSWEWVLVSLGLEYVSGSLVGPSFGAFIADQTSEEVRGRVFGISKSIFFVVGVVGPPLGGWLADGPGYRIMMWIAAVIYALATVLRIWMARAEQFKVEKPAEKPTLAGFKLRLGEMIALMVGGGVLTWIFITDGANYIAFKLSGELQPLYMEQFGGLTATSIGYLNSLQSIVMMALTLPAGWLSDRIGERKVIAGGFLLISAGIGVFVSVRSGTAIPAFIGFALSWAIMGAGFGVITPAYDSLVSKATPEHLRGTAFGFFQSSLGVISLPAPWLGSQLWERFGARTPFIFSGVATLLSIIPAWVKFKLPKKDSLADSNEAR